MQTLEGKTAVVTGAAAGIGRALGEAFLAEGMNVFLADRDEAALSSTAAELRGKGTVAERITDVTEPLEVDALAEAAFERFGAVHVVCNNAGVLGAILPSWQQPIETWDWVLNVNVRGVVNGIRAFTPRLIEQAEESYILNTGSIAGLITGPFFAPYNASKHAVVALSECLHHELRALKANVRVGVLCPGWVRTGLADLEAKLPPELRDLVAEQQRNEAVAARDQGVRDMVASSITPDEIAQHCVAAIREDRFYIFPHPERKADAALRMEDILAERTPEFPPRKR